MLRCGKFLLALAIMIAIPCVAAAQATDSKMIGGFALLAYPAEYGNSGVVTFLVNHSGTVYQKDLGNSTVSLAERMTWFDPDQMWKKVNTPSP